MSRDIDTKINLQTCFLIECCTGLFQFLLLKLQCENPEAIVCWLSAPEISSWFFFKEYAELLICSIVSNFLESNWKKCVVISLQSSLTIWRTSYFFISEQRGKKKTEDLIYIFQTRLLTDWDTTSMLIFFFACQSNNEHTLCFEMKMSLGPST